MEGFEKIALERKKKRVKKNEGECKGNKQKKGEEGKRRKEEGERMPVTNDPNHHINPAKQGKELEMEIVVIKTAKERKKKNK